MRHRQTLQRHGENMVGSLNTKFCTNCQAHQPILNGKFYWAGKIKRWKCVNCVKTIHNVSLMIRNAVARHKTEDNKCVTETVIRDEIVRVRIGEEQ